MTIFLETWRGERMEDSKEKSEWPKIQNKMKNLEYLIKPSSEFLALNFVVIPAVYYLFQLLCS